MAEYVKVADCSGLRRSRRTVATCRRAIDAGRRALPSLPMSRRLAEVVCSELLGAATEVRCVKCTIQMADGTVVYTPPSGQALLLELMGDWDRAMNQGGVDPLIQATVGHAHFEAIHPFVDGNGRTGRTLVLLHLLREGCLSTPVLSVSFRLRCNRPDYYRGLSEYRSKENWAPWTCFMLKAISRGAEVGRALLEGGWRPTSPGR